MTNEEIMKAVKPAICSQLKSPASAQFPVDEITITGDEWNGYHVEGYVDSQNGYGAMMRNDFTAEVQVSNGAPVVTSHSVGKKANAARKWEFGYNYLTIALFTIIGGAILYFLNSAFVDAFMG